jgi:integrase
VIEHIHTVKKPRNGKPPIWYIYAYRGGPQVLRHEGWEHPRLDPPALKKLLDAQCKVERVEQNTLSTLIKKWRPNSPEWKGLADSTKKTWGSALDRIEARWGKTPLAVWNDPRMKRKVVDWRDSRSETPRGADVGVQVLRALLEFGCLRGYVSINVAKGVPQLYRGGDRAEIVWTEADLQTFAAEAVKQNKQHVLDAVRLGALTGLRREDLTTLTWAEIHEHAIVKRAAKVSRGRRRTVTIPRVAALDGLLKELRTRPRNEHIETVLVSSKGKPWTPDGLNTAFSGVRDEIGIFHVDENGTRRAKHIHDLRGTFCTELLKAGLTDEQVADVMGWSPDQVRGIRRVYVDQGQVAVAIGERLRAGL